MRIRGVCANIRIGGCLIFTLVFWSPAFVGAQVYDLEPQNVTAEFDELDIDYDYSFDICNNGGAPVTEDFWCQMSVYRTDGDSECAIIDATFEVTDDIPPLGGVSTVD